MKKLFSGVMIIFLPLISVAEEGNLNGFYNTCWLTVEYADVAYSKEMVTPNANHRINAGYGLSIQGPVNLFDLNLIISGFMTGRNFQNYELKFDFQREFFFNSYLSTGISYVFWQLNEVEIDPGLGYQIAIEHSILSEDKNILAAQAGYKYNSSQLKNTDIDITSNAFFFRIGMYMGF